MRGSKLRDDERPPQAQPKGRRCRYCDGLLSVWNPNDWCYDCDGQFFEDPWEEYTTLPDHYQDSRLAGFPPPETDESATDYIRRILLDAKGAVPIYTLAKHHGYTHRQADTAFKVNCSWFKRRGKRLARAGGMGSGHVVVNDE